ncbi:hypothetical protein PENANT_c112G08728 [Penicillium antarcticum]|uniref:Grh/CP2 DB domain-containing protein n=1 Tax=Penicillium antarcticum TaxID=416450 RepID=A0A1V6PJY4_9EURO|nr:hypothetical protein PENANT_c112G08728 [Penicillium antarcticum]
MFDNRRNSQKPDDGLINKFRATFPDVVRSTKYDTSRLATKYDLNYLSTLDSSGLRFTPLFGDQSGLRFTPFLDYHTIPAPDPHNPRQYHDTGSLNTVFHEPAGDLHTPQPEPNLMTPRTLLEQFAVTPLHRNNIDPFQDNSKMQYSAHEPQTIAPSILNVSCQPTAFVHSHLADDAVNGSSKAVFLADDANPQNLSPHQLLTSQDSDSPEREYRSHGDNQFRYQVTLNTPTAMMKDPRHPPTTYLNKAQTYSLSIVDTAQPVTNEAALYRTWIRVTFEDDEQASNPAAAWALWRNARRHEAYRKERNINAIEFVDLSQENEGQTCHIQLERISLDGFCVTWLSDPTTGNQHCSMGVRFHFLSTDFSHAKGVKGAPIKLCAKTESLTSTRGEISYCKVKLFREHGAERKMFNDVSQLKRAIERCRQDLIKAENGCENLGKRKRGRHTVIYKRNKKLEDERKNELQRNLNNELAVMQKLVHSNRPVTYFCLRGSLKDDPGLFPVTMEDDETRRIDRVDHSTLQPLTPPSKLGSVSSNFSVSSTEHCSPSLRQYRDKSKLDQSPQALWATMNTKAKAPDDDFVQRIPDGQDMIAEISDIPTTMVTGGSTVEVSLHV